MTFARRLARLMAPAAARWILGERNRFHALAEPLGADDQEQLAEWFDPATLQRARIVHGRLTTPLSSGLGDAPLAAVRTAAQLWGHITGDKTRPQLVAPEAAAAMTFDHVIVFNESTCGWPPPRRLLVHELVHVAQYEQLGVHGFAEAYLDGWIQAGYEYRNIPLEVQAYRVEREFAAHLADKGVD